MDRRKDCEKTGDPVGNAVGDHIGADIAGRTIDDQQAKQDREPPLYTHAPKGNKPRGLAKSLPVPVKPRIEDLYKISNLRPMRFRISTLLLLAVLSRAVAQSADYTAICVAFYNFENLFDACC